MSEEQSFRASFNGIDCRTYGVYKLYGLNPLEVEILRRENSGFINGSGGDWTIYKNAKRYVYLKLYVHVLRKPILIDIRQELLHLTGKSKISQKLVKGLEQNLPKNIYVVKRGKAWFLQNPEIIEKAIHDSGY